MLGCGEARPCGEAALDKRVALVPFWTLASETANYVATVALFGAVVHPDLALISICNIKKRRSKTIVISVVARL